MLPFSVFFPDCKLNIFGVWTIGQTIKTFKDVTFDSGKPSWAFFAAFLHLVEQINQESSSVGVN